MVFLLDTNVVSALMREDPRMATWLSSTSPDDRLLICAVVRGEILFGLGKLAPGRRRNDLETKAQSLFVALPCEPIPPAAGDYYASVKLAQQGRGLPLDDNDLWIAATALALGATLVSSDSDFQRLDMLSVVTP